ncbi:unnamed protein product [Somion occarium]|uniref:ubiquitinyl hydrolase 1 n=1 Tax=Somion occarium TaxID=3059160 RepID=A0ABP1CQF9_9APHY
MSDPNNPPSEPVPGDLSGEPRTCYHTFLWRSRTSLTIYAAKLAKTLKDLPEDDTEPPAWATTDQAAAAAELSTLGPSTLFNMNEATIEDTIPKDRPLIAPLAPMAVLRAEYENGNTIFVKQIDWLVDKGYKGVRRTRGDGDCFYRSLAFAYVERIMHSDDPELNVMRAISTLETTPAMLSSVGFQELVFEDFFDIFKNLIMRIVQPEPGKSRLTARALFDTFNNPEESNSIVMYLRLLTSAQIRLDPEEYAPFLFHPEIGEPMETVTFCENFVEAVGKEADHVQMTALTRALRVNVNVAYLDGHAHKDGEIDVDFVQFENAPEPEDPITLLYRPGHYDILDNRDQESLTLEPL